MKRYISLGLLVLSCLLTLISCRKEKTLEQSGMDENYYVVKDNPNDPVDHAIYQFFESTGIPSYYNDTIYKKKVKENAGTPVWSYIKLSLNYNPFGNTYTVFEPLANKNSIPAILDLMKEEVLPKIPEDMGIRSFFFIKNYRDTVRPLINVEPHDGMTACIGFNTIGIVSADVVAMDAGEKKMYAASILAGLAVNRIIGLAGNRLINGFYSVSRTAAASFNLRADLYSGLPLFVSLTPDKFPAPDNLGLIRYVDTDAFKIPLPQYTLAPPTEDDDVRAYLTAAFYYTPQELNTIYANAPLILQKFGVLMNIARESGFKFPE